MHLKSRSIIHRPSTTSGIDQYKGAKRSMGQDAERGCRDSHAAMADCAAEYRRIRPAMQADSPRTTSERRQRVRVQAQRQDKRTVGGLRRRERRHDESPSGRRRRPALAHCYRPFAQQSTAEEDAKLSRRKIDPDEVGTAPGIKLRGSCAAGIDPAGGTIRSAREQHALPAGAALYDWYPSRRAPAATPRGTGPIRPRLKFSKLRPAAADPR
jgi:hypothetical protein